MEMLMKNEKISKLYILFFGLILHLLFSSSAAAISPEKDMSLKNVTYFLTDTEEPGIKKYVMEADLNASKKQVCSVVCNYYKMNTYMPKEIYSEVLKDENDQITLKVIMDLPWPFTDLESILLIDLDMEKGNAQWKLIGGNIKKHSGHLQLAEIGGRSHIKQTTYIDIGRYYPDWFIKIYTRTLTHKIMTAIRNQVAAEAAVFTKVKKGEPKKVQ
jgi:hypothetical protein